MTDMPLARSRLLPTARVALFFNGVNQYAHAPHFYYEDHFTVVARFMFPHGAPPTRNQPLISNGFTSAGRDWWLVIDRRPELFPDRGVPLFETRGGERIVNFDYYVYGGVWNHVAVVTSRGMYVNGVLVASGSINIGAVSKGTAPLTVGIDGVHRYMGYVSEVLIYSRALSKEEILWDFYYPDNPVRDGLVLWLHWDSIDTDKGMWYDKSGFGNHATLYNNPVKEDVLLPPKRLLSPTRTLTPVR